MTEREKRDAVSEMGTGRGGRGGGTCPFTIRECALKLTPRTFTIVYLNAVTGIIPNNSQEAVGIAVTKTLEPECPSPKPSSVT